MLIRCKSIGLIFLLLGVVYTMAQILMNGYSVPFEKGTILNNYSQATGFPFVTEIQFESADLKNDEAKPTIAGYGEGQFEIVDGRVFYEIKEGDSVPVMRPDGMKEMVEYTEDRFPLYDEGWFGFRLVNSHHINSDFKVYRLEPTES